jgi:hypothetical protein
VIVNQVVNVGRAISVDGFSAIGFRGLTFIIAGDNIIAISSYTVLAAGLYIQLS